ncbi:poly-gamma-glutamate synthesis protein (capsule biosynthesis protein) [Bacillus mesophilus]|uniref:CapA family protein n=1 Tax=Bacillus mesophilus TaxID=1808955 RepID=A0A6M0QAZ6_9BACI|nr:CapA family protein [Bacillus mesophilus]MBM7663110.1 poly-gamma-glutamate synthesis protein (capsule biosynthesis protein) [Bacillus mesophilus]NEY73571.1 CapA family protein [Bacillus mesophilus]
MNKRILFISISSFVLLSVIFVLFIQKTEPSLVTNDPIKVHLAKENNLTSKDFKSSATISAVGDILIHSLVYNAAKTNTGYDFSPMFSEVKPYLENADLTFANQETMIGGQELGLSTYPRFNSPYELADTLKDSGVDIVSIANNHTIDRGVQAVQNATNYYDKIGMQYTGGYASKEDSQVIRTIKRNGISFSFLAYTYGTNGIPIPEEHPYIVNLIDLPKIAKDIELAKEISDVVVVSLHFGNEYQRMPSEEQRQIATEVIAAGADLILGHHPHVLQPMEWVKTENGNKGFVVYSLGNFLSGQKSIYREIGGIFTLTVNKEVSNGKRTITLQDPSFISTYVSKSHRYKVVPLENASQYGLSGATTIFEEITAHMNQLLPEKEIAQAD